MNLRKGNLYLIIAIIVGVIAIGAVGFASWKYFGGGSELEKGKSQPSYLLEQEKTIPQIEEQEEIKKEEIISSKKTDETTNWKTYRNTEYGYEIKYPKNWNLAEVSKDPFGMTIWEGDGFNKGNIQMAEAYGFVSRGHIEGNLDYLKKRLKTKFNELEEISITNGRGFYWIVQGKGGLNPSVYLVNKNHLFFMTCNIFEDTENALVQSESIFNQILSTFRFIETDGTANWKTYKNKKYGFEIKYPQDWKVANNVLSFEPDLVFCPTALATNSDPKVICKMKEGGANTLKPVYENGMIYLFASNTNPNSNNPNYRYFGFGGTILKYYCLFSESNEAEVNQILSTFKFT